MLHSLAWEFSIISVWGEDDLVAWVHREVGFLSFHFSNCNQDAIANGETLMCFPLSDTFLSIDS
jgi:hypothetical protein